MSKISHDLLLFSHVQKGCKNFIKILHRYIDFAYLLRQYLRILTHPIIHFLHFWHCIQFCSIHLKNIFSLKSQCGALTPKTPLPTPLETWHFDFSSGSVFEWTSVCLFFKLVTCPYNNSDLTKVRRPSYLCLRPIPTSHSTLCRIPSVLQLSKHDRRMRLGNTSV